MQGHEYGEEFGRGAAELDGWGDRNRGERLSSAVTEQELERVLGKEYTPFSVPQGLQVATEEQERRLSSLAYEQELAVQHKKRGSRLFRWDTVLLSAALVVCGILIGFSVTSVYLFRPPNAPIFQWGF
ncbi:hypothetical protein MRY87_07025 [bacterium]|nr:hypothetical protein [bacterium]